jgi:hypothetical protein
MSSGTGLNKRGKGRAKRGSKKRLKRWAAHQRSIRGKS